jgi:hypothetical protein
MRRQLRQALPALAHWFGIRPADIDDMPYGELEEFLARLKKLPPIGAVALVDPKQRR